MALQRRVTCGAILTALILCGFSVAAAFAETAPGTPTLKKKPLPSVAQSLPGCTWVSQKALFAILREDIVSANDLMVLFDRFECPKLRLRQAFDCAVAQSSLQNADALNAMINTCWEDPATPAPKSTSPASTPSKKPQ